MKKLLIFLSGCILLLIAILIVNTFRLESRQYNIPEGIKIQVGDSVGANLAKTIRMKTISYDTSSKTDSNEFRNLILFLEKKYPLSDSLLDRTIINSLSLLYCWKGRNPSLKPVILLAHLDVVPPEGEWENDPFGGAIKDGYIWGRGTLDDKVSVLGILEATEKLLAEGFTPERTVYFAFGHDEETGGNQGASLIAEWLRKNKVEAEFLLDEGLVVTEGIVPGMEKPVALIGIAEKGYMSLQLSVQMHGGHSSMPEKETAIGVLSSAIHKLEKNPLKAHLSEPAQKFLQYLGPEMGLFKKIIFANRWLFEKLILNTYEKTPAGNALIRTTIAPTIVKAGVKENVIPEEASAIINLRILPGEEKDEIMRNLKEKMEDDRIKIDVLRYDAPSDVSTDKSFGYQIIDSTIRKVFPQTIIAPSLMIAGTDSKHYGEITKNRYRFLPVRLRKEDLQRIHGKDERISVEGYKDVIRFYYFLLKNI